MKPTHIQPRRRTAPCRGHDWRDSVTCGGPDVIGGPLFRLSHVSHRTGAPDAATPIPQSRRRFICALHPNGGHVCTEAMYDRSIVGRASKRCATAPWLRLRTRIDAAGAARRRGPPRRRERATATTPPQPARSTHISILEVAAALRTSSESEHQPGVANRRAGMARANITKPRKCRRRERLLLRPVHRKHRLRALVVLAVRDQPVRERRNERSRRTRNSCPGTQHVACDSPRGQRSMCCPQVDHLWMLLKLHKHLVRAKQLSNPCVSARRCAHAGTVP